MQKLINLPIFGMVFIRLHFLNDNCIDFVMSFWERSLKRSSQIWIDFCINFKIIKSFELFWHEMKFC